MTRLDDWMLTVDGELFCTEPHCPCVQEQTHLLSAGMYSLRELVRAIRDHRERFGPDGKL